jgi:hypothetical protein
MNDLGSVVVVVPQLADYYLWGKDSENLLSTESACF